PARGSDRREGSGVLSQGKAGVSRPPKAKSPADHPPRRGAAHRGSPSGDPFRAGKARDPLGARGERPVKVSASRSRGSSFSPSRGEARRGVEVRHSPFLDALQAAESKAAQSEIHREFESVEAAARA